MNKFFKKLSKKMYDNGWMFGVILIGIALFIIMIAILFGIEKEGFINSPPNNVRCQFLKETKEKVQQEMSKVATGGEDANENERRDGQINTGLNYYNMQGRDIYLKLGKISGHECF